MIVRADARRIPVADGSVQCVVTSPPYWGLRDYKTDGQIGLEESLDQYVANLVEVFREVRRVLRDDGICWVNLGDAYNAAGRVGHGTRDGAKQGTNRASANGSDNSRPTVNNLKPKDMIGLPWRVAFALQADGWWLRSDIIWSKPNPMPESVTDRPTRAHEYVFLLTKSARYYYDADAIKEQPKASTIERLTQPNVMTQPGGPKDDGKGNRSHSKVRKNLAAKFGGANKAKGYGTRKHSGREDEGRYVEKGVNKRTVWTVATQPSPEAHFATFPERLIEPMILAGSRPNDLVLDPFGGTGTTARVARRLGRVGIACDLSMDYCRIAARLEAETPAQGALC